MESGWQRQVVTWKGVLCDGKPQPQHDDRMGGSAYFGLVNSACGYKVQKGPGAAPVRDTAGGQIGRTNSKNREHGTTLAVSPSEM